MPSFRSFGWQPVPVCQQGGADTFGAFTPNGGVRTGRSRRRIGRVPRPLLLLYLPVLFHIRWDSPGTSGSVTTGVRYAAVPAATLHARGPWPDLCAPARSDPGLCWVRSRGGMPARHTPAVPRVPCTRGTPLLRSVPLLLLRVPHAGGRAAKRALPPGFLKSNRGVGAAPMARRSVPSGYIAGPRLDVPGVHPDSQPGVATPGWPGVLRPRWVPRVTTGNRPARAGLQSRIWGSGTLGYR